MFNTKRWRRLSIITLTILSVIITLAIIAFDQAAALNAAFKIQTYKIIKDDTSEENSNYFELDYTTFGPNGFSDRNTNLQGLKAYMDETCEELEAEGLVLLKNDNNALPLAKNSKVSLFFQGSYNFNYSTSGSSATTSTADYPTLTDALTRSGLTVNTTLNEFNEKAYSDGFKRGKPNMVYMVREIGYDAYTVPVKSSFSEYGDAAIFVLSRDSGEGNDITTTGSDGEDGTYLSLTSKERGVLEEITKLKNDGVFSKIIVILNTAVPIQLDFIDNENIDIDSIIWSGNVGSTGIYALGKALVGDINPSGKLSDTFVKDSFSSPAMAIWELNPNKKFTRKYENYKDYTDIFNETQNCYAVYVEGIYVGYRYYETRYEDNILGNTTYDYDADVAYPFGYGISYTNFTYTNFTVAEQGDSFKVSVNVKNTGTVPGKESVQIYMQKPYTDYDIINDIEKASIELVGFNKTKLLSPNEDETVEITIPKEMMKSYDAYGMGTYILDDGDYYLSTGKSSHDALNNIILAKGYTPDSQANASLTYKYTVDEFDADTYSKSLETGNDIINRFEFADFNLYQNSGYNAVTYVSRKDWEGTWPTESIVVSLSDGMVIDNTPNKPIIEDGSTMPIFSSDSGLSLIMLKGIEYDNELWDKLLNQMSYQEMSYLITNGQHNTVLVESVNKPATRDENGPNGVSGSLTGTAFPSEGIWASSFNPELLKKAGKALGEDAVAAGITGLYASGVNIHRTPFGGRAHEYFSEDPVLSGLASMYETIGMQEKGVWAYVKHFAVNNEETNRNGVAVFLNEQELREIMLVPFEYSFRPSMGNAHATMTSFNRIGVFWTSACSSLMEDVLRDEWGFDGFAITDMAASNAKSFMTFVDGINNGSDCYDGPGSKTALDEYRSSARFANKMREACHRILYVTVNDCAVMNGVSSTDKIVKQASWWEITVIGLIAISGALAACSITLLTLSYIKGKK